MPAKAPAKARAPGVISAGRAPALSAFRPLGEGRNPNRHTQQGLGQLEAAMDLQGYVAPMTAARNGAILDGNARLEKAATKFDGVAPLVVEHDGRRPVIMVRTDIADEDDPLARDIIVSANRVAQVDLDLDLDVLKSFAADGLDLAPYEFDAGMLREITGGTVGKTDPDTVPAERATDIKPGDLFELGKHRLQCGDCTKAEDVARLMGKNVALIMNTDPPYGVGLDLTDNHEASNAAKGIDVQYRHFKPVVGDDLTGEQLQRFLEVAIRTAVPHLSKHAAFYLWHPMLTQGTFFAAAAAAADILIHRQIIWVKPHFIFGRGDYHWKHELCFYGWQRGFRPNFYGERNQDTVWLLDEGGGSIRKDQHHPTQKPVELFLRPIYNHTRTDEAIYEPFGGSGSQFVAAEQTQRRCLGLEIEPGYCQVIIDRWEAFVGNGVKAVKVGEAVRV